VHTPEEAVEAALQNGFALKYASKYEKVFDLYLSEFSLKYYYQVIYSRLSQ